MAAFPAIAKGTSESCRRDTLARMGLVSSHTKDWSLRLTATGGSGVYDGIFLASLGEVFLVTPPLLSSSGDIRISVDRRIGEGCRATKCRIKWSLCCRLATDRIWRAQT
jgi:hypothetical protein